MPTPIYSGCRAHQNLLAQVAAYMLLITYGKSIWLSMQDCPASDVAAPHVERLVGEGK